MNCSTPTKIPTTKKRTIMPAKMRSKTAVVILTRILATIPIKGPAKKVVAKGVCRCRASFKVIPRAVPRAVDRWPSLVMTHLRSMIHR